MMALSCFKNCCRPIPQKIVVSTMVLLGISLQLINRLSLEVALVDITQRVITEHILPVCPNIEKESWTSEKLMEAEFFWTFQEQADLLGSFYAGYLITHLPGGFLSDSVGPKIMMGGGIFISGVCVLLTPICARATGMNCPWVLMVNRLVMGLAQGPLFPSMSAFIARWSVPEERGFMCAYMVLGVSLGAIYSFIVFGIFLHGIVSWDSLFHFHGIFTLLFTIPWYLFAHDRPNEHPFINEDERQQINDSLKGELGEFWTSLPFRDIMKSAPVWAMIIAHIARDGNYNVLLTLLPRYMDCIFEMHVTKNALVSCSPYVIMALFGILSTILAQHLLNKGWLSKTNQVKLWCFLSNILSSVFILLSVFSGCNYFAAVSFFILAFGFMGLGVSSILIVNVDMAPNHAGLLMGLQNMPGGFLGLLHSRLVAIFKEQDTVTGWRIGFIATSVFASITTIFFVVYGSAELQPWNKPREALMSRTNSENSRT